jgi:hypothetical protein
MYNLSGRQAGIQAGHAALEYVSAYAFDQDTPDKDLIDFVKNHKTFIVLDGGTSGTMIDRMDELAELGIPFAAFREPDLNYSTSAIAFLVNESEYDPSEDEILYKTNPVYEYLRQFRLASN